MPTDTTTLDLPITRTADVESDVAAPAAIEWLVDNADTYDALLRAIDGAARRVWISQLAFDADCRAWGAAHGREGRLLIHAVHDASARGVDVRILLNESLLLDTATPLRRALARAGAHGVQVRGVSRFPSLLHAKVVIVDEDEAFLVGSPFVNGYWDDPSHEPEDDRRPARELGGRPLHDVSTRVTGAPVHALAALFATFWRADGDDEPAAIAHGPAPDPSTVIVRTAPGAPDGAHGGGRAEILPIVLEAIASARSLIYIEHQYLSARPVVAALADALARAPELEIVVVLNQNPDVTAYRVWQNSRLRESGLLAHPRVGLFALWTARHGGAAGWSINQLFVHSKVLLVDDRWATVGSANLDGVSLHSYGDDFESWIGRRVFRGVRNFDVNLVIARDRTDPENAVRDLRQRLWAEHLGDDDAVADERPAAGWLAAWRERASGNVEALGQPHGAAWRGHLLPYSVRSTPAAQLADVGIPASAPVSLRFDPGWLEVHCSPNWVRNMFA